MSRKRKYLQHGKTTFAIIVDGETERWYFHMLKRNEPTLQVNIEPKIPHNKKLSELFEKVCTMAEDYSKVFWIIDLDKIIQDSKVYELKRYLKKLENKKFTNIITIINNPCLEYWFFLHFEPKTKYFSKCSYAERELKKHLSDYKKTKIYYTKQNNDIYLRLKNRLPTAISNSRKTQREKFNNVKRGICEMNLFFETGLIKKTIKFDNKIII